MKFYKILI